MFRDGEQCVDLLLVDGEVATVKLRYKHPDGDESMLIERVVIDEGASFGETTTDFLVRRVSQPRIRGCRYGGVLGARGEIQIEGVRT